MTDSAVIKERDRIEVGINILTDPSPGAGISILLALVGSGGKKLIIEYLAFTMFDRDRLRWKNRT